jgi:hypothetical protein
MNTASSRISWVAANKKAEAEAKAAKNWEQERLRRELDCQRKDALVAKYGLLPSEAEAVVAHFGIGRSSFPKDTLMAFRTLNGFAAKNGIRVQDAEVVLKETVDRVVLKETVDSPIRDEVVRHHTSQASLSMDPA